MAQSRCHGCQVGRDNMDMDILCDRCSVRLTLQKVGFGAVSGSLLGALVTWLVMR